MPEKFACAKCGHDLIILKLDRGKEALCPRCSTWNGIPDSLEKSDEPLNCRVRTRNVFPGEPRNEEATPLPPTDSGSDSTKGFRHINVADQMFRDETGEFRDLLIKAAPGAIVTRVLIAINVFLFMIQAFNGVNPIMPALMDLIRWGAKFNYRILNNNEWWRLITSIFVQAGIMHLALNMWFLWISGNLAERIFGSTAFWLLYFAGGLGGSIASFLLSSSSVSAAASAPIFGIAGGLIAVAITGTVRIPRIFVRKIIQDLVIFGVISIGLGFFIRGVDNIVNVGGLGVGFLSGLALKRSLVTEDESKLTKRYFAFGGAGIALILVAVFIGPMFLNKNAGGELEDLAHVENLLLNQKIDEALVILEKKPELVLSLENREKIQGLLYEKRGDFNNAILSLTEALRKNPKDLGTHSLLGWVYLQKKSYKEAADAFRGMISMAPDNGIAYGNLAWTYYLMGDRKACLLLSKKAVELDPNLTFARYNIGLSMLALGNGKEALEYYRNIRIEDGIMPQETVKGAIDDLLDLVRKGIYKEEAKKILAEVFKLKESEIE
jgi:membrane associated rhomboid family serine protease